jgi:hypothetical protein
MGLPEAVPGETTARLETGLGPHCFEIVSLVYPDG